LVDVHTEIGVKGLHRQVLLGVAQKEVAPMNRRNLVVLAGVLILASHQVASAQTTYKEHFKEGEKLLKQGKGSEAFDELQKALDAAPTVTEQYRAKLREAGKLASAQAVLSGESQIEAAPHLARDWFLRALKYDSSNPAAAEKLALVNKNIASARETCQRAQSALDAGDLPVANSLVKSLEIYREAVPEVGRLKRELSAAETALVAEALWQKNDPDDAIRQLSEAESSAPGSLFVGKVSERVRRAMAEALVTKASQLPAKTPEQVIERILIARAAQQVRPQDEKARLMEGELSTELVDEMLNRNKSFLKENESANAHRIAAQRLKTIEAWTRSDSRLTSQITATAASAYPRLRVRVLIGDLESCKTGLTREALISALGQALSPLVLIDAQEWDFTLSLKSIACSATDIPKQSVEASNSTYIAGYNQVTNPRYVQLQQELQTAQADLNRAVYNQSVNPNFGTGLATGLAQGRVDNIQKAIRQTQPFISQPIIQQYKYERFESYRGYKMDARLQLNGKPGAGQYITESVLSEVNEGRGQGIAGVLPSDNSGLRNVESGMLPIEIYQQQAVNRFDADLRSKARELVDGFFATTAMNRATPAVDRFAALLYLFDLAEGTQYEQEKQKLSPSINKALLSDLAGNMDGLLSSLSLPVPDQIALAADAQSDDSNAVGPVLERTLDGVLAIETDTGAEGSGFFVTPGCLVVTNAHVVEGSETIVLKTSSKRLFTAQVLAKDSGRDLALLRSNARVCTPLPLDNSNGPAVGQEVYAIGNPLGFSGTVTRGIVSALRQDSGGIQYVQLDATINPGNSGGPLISRTGTVLGVNTFKVRGFEGLNFAVAAKEIKNAFGQIFQ
jgi:S1-C subfamily serine protease